jgi:hypothetical protein
MPAQPTTANCFAVHTDSGEGDVSTERFSAARDRLDSLRQRAQEYFPGRDVPRTPADTDEAPYLAQLLGFFLMFKGGKVTLEDVTILKE